MRILFISDIHGSSSSLEQVLHYYQDWHCDKLVILGDILYHGPRNPIPNSYNPQKVVSLLNAMKNQIIAVRGNCDAEVDQMLLEFPCMSDYAQLYERDNEFFLTHGHIYAPDKKPNLPDAAIMMYGHTHLWELRKEGTFVYCNPGSITLPKENRSATFALYDQEILSICELSTGEILKSIQL